jgi:chromosomal replication initiator protein
MDRLKLNQHNDLWKRAQARLSPQIGTDVFDRWLAGCQILNIQDQSILIGVPTQITLIWIESNFLSLIAQALAEELQQAIKVKLELCPVLAGVFEERLKNPLASSPAHIQSSEELMARPLEEKNTAAAPPEATQRDLAVEGMNSRYLFENFVAGPNCRYAWAAAKAVADNPAKTYNPFFIHGATGLGKTHLMQAIGHELKRRRPQNKVVYVTSEQFTNEFIEAIQNGSLTKFRRRFRHVDLLLIDDIQFFAGRERSQEEFFHTFNSLLDGHKQIVLTCDRPPGEVAQLQERLVSRFEWGMTAHMSPPDLETRVAILRKKLSSMRMEIDDWVLMYLAERISSNVRRLEGALTRIASFVGMAGRSPKDRREIDDNVGDLFAHELVQAVTIDHIQRVVAEHFDLRLADMTSRRRPANIAFPRQMAMALSRELTPCSFAEIGEAFGGRDHGTVMHACKTVRERSEVEPAVQQIMAELQKTLKSA